MAKTKLPVTPAVRVLRQHGVDYTGHLFEYEAHGGAAQGARELGAGLHETVKTLVLEDDDGAPLVVLMHGDLQVSTRGLARALGLKSVAMCAPQTATKHSGYQVGGTSPFGLRRAMPVYMEQTIAALPRVYINGGRRGFLLGMDPADIVRVLRPVLVNVGVPT